MKTVIVWFRNDLRVHDHPALAAASGADKVVPVFIFNEGLLQGKHWGSNRNRFLLESLADLDTSLRAMGSALVYRRGKPDEVLAALAAETKADAVFATADYTAYALQRDKRVHDRLASDAVLFRLFPGRLIVSKLEVLQTKAGSAHKIFTPFWKNWQQIGRRDLAEPPEHLRLPEGLDPGKPPELSEISDKPDLSPEVLPGGERAGRERLHEFLEDGVQQYHERNDRLDLNGTSRLSPYLHFGCVSPLEIEAQLPPGEGPAAWQRQLCWRDFYHYVLFHFPENATKEFQERYRDFDWSYDEGLLEAWQTGRTGYPVVDAAMRQLNTEGWMHNRARLIVGSFLTKDLGLDWRLGERYFMRMLMDGDEANNNGNWQWIASVGVDPAPVFRRLYNPTSQQTKFDPEGTYVRTHVPELRNVPDKYLAEPWTMPEAMQHESGCVIGRDYPAPVINHAEARVAALERFRR